MNTINYADKNIDEIIHLLPGILYRRKLMEQAELKKEQEILLSKRMTPDKSEWEKLGYSFNDNNRNGFLCNAVLPEGWTIKPTEDKKTTHIVDENGNIRASMYYDASVYTRAASMKLLNKYDICEEKTNVSDEGYTSTIYFGNQAEKLFVAGSVYIPNTGLSEEVLSAWGIKAALREDAEAFADEI